MEEATPTNRKRASSPASTYVPLTSYASLFPPRKRLNTEAYREFDRLCMLRLHEHREKEAARAEAAAAGKEAAAAGKEAAAAGKEAAITSEPASGSKKKTKRASRFYTTKAFRKKKGKTETEEEKHKRWRDRQEARLVAIYTNNYVRSPREDEYGCESEGEAYFFGYVDTDGDSNCSDDDLAEGRVGPYFIMNENTGSKAYYP